MRDLMDAKTGTTVCDMETSSAVAWPAILAGGFAAVALTLTLMILGSGLGFAAMSPWTHTEHPVATLTVTTVVWLILTQWASAGVGGYLTGRLRTRWLQAHPHEVFFRDTAHGLLTWCVASVFMAACFTMAASSVAGGGVQAGATLAAGKMAQGGHGMADGPDAYYVDSLFRKDQPETASAGTTTNSAMGDHESNAETSRIVMNGVKAGKLPDADKAYLARLVSARTGLAPDAAASRVDQVMAELDAAEAKAAEMAETARKTAASLSIFTALSMLIGAFIASVTAALGGKCRDEDLKA